MEEAADVHTVHSFVDSIDTFLFDCDGVLWSGSSLIPGALDTLQMLHDKVTRWIDLATEGSSCNLVAELLLQGKKIFYVTNNSTLSRVDYVNKMKKLGINASKV